MSTGCFDGTIQAMFDLSDQTVEAMCNSSNKISDKQHEILKQLREQNISEYYKNIDTNLQ